MFLHSHSYNYPITVICLFFSHTHTFTLSSTCETRQPVTPRSRSPNTDKSWEGIWEKRRGGGEWSVGKKKRQRQGKVEEWSADKGSVGCSRSFSHFDHLNIQMAFFKGELSGIRRCCATFWKPRDIKRNKVFSVDLACIYSYCNSEKGLRVGFFCTKLASLSFPKGETYQKNNSFFGKVTFTKTRKNCFDKLLKTRLPCTHKEVNCSSAAAAASGNIRFGWITGECKAGQYVVKCGPASCSLSLHDLSSELTHSHTHTFTFMLRICTHKIHTGRDMYSKQTQHLPIIWLCFSIVSTGIKKLMKNNKLNKEQCKWKWLE